MKKKIIHNTDSNLYIVLRHLLKCKKNMFVLLGFGVCLCLLTTCDGNLEDPNLLNKGNTVILTMII